MNTSELHYWYEGKQSKILCIPFIPFCRFSKGAFCRNSLISRGKNDRLKLSELLNLIWHIGNKIRQVSISLV